MGFAMIVHVLDQTNKGVGVRMTNKRKRNMGIKTTYCTREHNMNEFAKGFGKLRAKLSKVEQALTEEMYPLQKDSYHLLTHFLVPENKHDRLLFSHIFRSMYRAELLSAGGAFFTTASSVSFGELLLSRYVDLLTTNHYELMEANQKKEKKIGEVISNNSKRINPKELRELISRVCEDSALSTAVWEAINLAGMEGNIHIEDSSSSVYGVELRHGYSFAVNPFKFFLSSLGTWESYNTKVMCVDGIIEKVSEMDKILLRSSETKIPLILVAQGFSEEVIATIKANNDRGVFNINPVRLEQSLENLNILNDIAVVCGGDVVSVLKGQMLVYVDYDSLPIVEHVKLTDREILIRNTSSRGSVAVQIKQLVEKRNNQQSHEGFDVVKLLDNRIANLISHSVVIRVPNLSDSQKQAVRTRVDIALRTARTALNYGVVDKEKLLQHLSTHKRFDDPWDGVYHNCLTSVLTATETTHPIPALSLYAGFRYGTQTAVQLLSAAGCVVEVG